MGPGLRMELVDREATPAAVWVRAADAPPGRWERFWHNPRPVTPLYADFEFGSHLALSEIVAADEYAAIARAGLPGRPRRLYLVIDGFAYRGEPAPGFEWGWLDPAIQAAAARSGHPPEQDAEGDYEWQVLRRWQEETRSALIGALRRFRAVDLPGLSDEALHRHIRALSLHLVEAWALYFTLDAAALLVRRRCQAFLCEQPGTTEAELLQLLAGSSPATSEPILRLDELARAVLATPALRTALDASDPWGQPGIRAALTVYLDAFGHRASEWEYSGPTLAERPERAVELLREAVRRVEAGQPSALEVARQRRDTAVAALRGRLPTASLRAAFDHQLRDAQQTFAIHEDTVTLYMEASGCMRYALLEAGARLARSGLLPDAERVLFLRRTELEAALLGSPPPELAQVTTERWAAYQQQLHADPPRVIEVAAPGAVAPAARPQPPSSPASADGLLRGLGASPGTYLGRARVIVGEEQFEEVQAGEILVCPQTSPSWTILFGRIGALVTDDGGILSHPAIAAREFGIPAVVATGGGTRALPTGQLIEVDGTSGTVRVVGAGREAGSGSVVWLGDPAASEIELVGGKAAHLSRLAGSYRVPPGFCLTAEALARCAEALARCSDRPGGLWGADGPDDGLRLPQDLYDEVAEAYSALARRCGEPAPSVAVRSSAIDEDSGAASFAGQHETYLNVRGTDAVARAIARCWRSLYAPRALEYRRQRGVALGNARLAVLVQQLVRADASAVLFSANPVTKAADQVVLTATWGLGESLVGGSVSPDSYLIRKHDLAVEQSQIAIKQRMTVLAEGGTREVEVPAALQARPAIDRSQALEAVRLTLELERTFGWPVDVECAWEQGTLYLLQCRPITTL